MCLITTASSLLLLLGLALPTWANNRWSRLSEGGRRAIELRRTVRTMQRSGQLLVAHPEVAKRLSTELSTKLGRAVTIPARRIVQVEFDSPAHHRLRNALKNSLGVGIYPSARWGHNKLRIGDLVADSVPKGSRPFPSLGTRARVVPFTAMHRRFYEAVFTTDPASLAAAESKARELAGQRAQRGMGCSSFATKILREHLADPKGPYAGKLETLVRSESAAGKLWRKAAGAAPALIVVYTPAGDYRSVANPGFKFDYVKKAGE